MTSLAVLSIKVNSAESEALVICESPGESEQCMSACCKAGRCTDVLWMRAVITSHRKPTRALRICSSLTQLHCRHENHHCPEGWAPRDVSLGGLHVKPFKKHTQHRKLHSACSLLARNPYAKTSFPTCLLTCCILESHGVMNRHSLCLPWAAP